MRRNGKKYWLIPGQLAFEFTYGKTLHEIVLEAYEDRGVLAYMKKVAGARWEELRHLVIEKLLTQPSAVAGVKSAYQNGKLNRYVAKVARRISLDMKGQPGGEVEDIADDPGERTEEIQSRLKSEKLSTSAVRLIYSHFTDPHSPHHFKALYFIGSIKAGSNRALSRSTGIPEKAIRRQKREYIRIINENINNSRP